VVPEKHPKTTLMTAATLSGAVRRVGAMSDGGIAPMVTMDIVTGECTVSAAGALKGEGVEAFEIKYEGPALRLGIPPRHFADMLKAAGTEGAQIDFKESLDPIVFRPVGDESFTGVVMPMRLDR
jgi:DNA polymerase-3 subunit beta